MGIMRIDKEAAYYENKIWIVQDISSSGMVTICRSGKCLLVFEEAVEFIELPF